MLKSKLIKILSGLVIVFGLFLAGWLVGAGNTKNLNSTTGSSVVEQAADKSVSVMFDFGDGTVKTFTEVSLPKDSASVFDVLLALSNEKKLALVYKDYGGDLGIFIQSINAVPGEGASDRWWQFWVNNIYSQIGVSNSLVKAGDVIEFKIIKGQ
ncbi:MAG: DUF4430 domain-containing protein [Candidatus Uhrbacteria bacterium]